MTYLVFQRSEYSFEEEFDITDSKRRPIYHVSDRSNVFYKSYAIEDAKQNEVIRVDKVAFSGGHSYVIYVGSALRATMKKEWFTFGLSKFTIDIPGPNDIEVRGELGDQNYVFYRFCDPIATVTRDPGWTDRYVVEINEGEEDTLILAACLAIDMACHDHKPRRDRYY